MNINNAVFHINKEKGVIICILPNTQEAFIDFVSLNFSVIQYYPNKMYNKLLMPKSFIGVATLADGDTWDEDFGKFLAYSRARDKYNKSFFKRAATFINEMETSIDQMVNVINLYGKSLEKSSIYRHNKINLREKDIPTA